MFKKINFNGDEIITVTENGAVYISVKHICKNLKMTHGQYTTQLQKIQRDETLKIGCMNFHTGVFDPNNATIGINLSFLHLWLAKINPSRFSDELKAKLLDYQLHAKDVLADAFLGKRSSQEEESREYSPHLNEILDRARTLTELETEKRGLLKRITEINRLLYFNYHMINWRASDRKGIIENEDKYIEHSFKTNFTMNDSELTTLEIDELNMKKEEDEK